MKNKTTTSKPNSKSLLEDKTYVIFLIFVFMFYIIFYKFINYETKNKFIKQYKSFFLHTNTLYINVYNI